MKKLILLTCICTRLSTCCVPCNTTLPPDAVLRSSLKSTDSVNYQITLNGVDSTDASKMKNWFLTYHEQDKRPARETFWFSRTAISRMYDLLTAERALETSQYNIGPGQKGFTDGIRIYFVSDTTVKKGCLNNSIILVSTKNDGPAPDSVPSKAYHLDYYAHSKKDILFSNLDSIRGQCSPRNILKNKGQNLYNICIGCDTTPPCDTNKPHYITQRKAHNMVSHFGQHPIVTTSEWFDYDLIKDLATDPEHDGLRIYFARHPVKFKGKADKYASKDAFIWVTTRPDKTDANAHDDYFDCKTTQEYFQKYIKRIGWNKVNPRGGDDGGTPGGEDDGELCPSNCKQ